jgi:integrase
MVSNMKKAMVKLYAFIFNIDLSQAPILRMAMRTYTLQDLPKREMLRLKWSVEQLFDYLRKLLPFEKMQFDQLTGVCIVMCIAFSALRFTEMMTLDLLETDPEKDMSGWKLWAHVKGHDYREPVTVHAVEDKQLDTVCALYELKKRILEFSTKNKVIYNSFWYKYVSGKLRLLTYDELRGEAKKILVAAGIKDNRPYHIKHAVLTCLHENGASAKDIAAFARHRFESMAAYQHYVSYDGGRASVQKLVGKKWC